MIALIVTSACLAYLFMIVLSFVAIRRLGTKLGMSDAVCGHGTYYCYGEKRQRNADLCFGVSVFWPITAVWIAVNYVIGRFADRLEEKSEH